MCGGHATACSWACIAGQHAQGLWLAGRLLGQCHRLLKLCGDVAGPPLPQCVLGLLADDKRTNMGPQNTSPALPPACLANKLLLRAPSHAHSTLQEERQEPDADFKPNLINTICFLANFAIQVGAACCLPACTGAQQCKCCGVVCQRSTPAHRPTCAPSPGPPLCSPPVASNPTQTMTFAVNYVGAPFNTPLEENRLFAASVRWSAALYVALVIDIPRGEHCCDNVVRHAALRWGETM